MLVDVHDHAHHHNDHLAHYLVHHHAQHYRAIIVVIAITMSKQYAISYDLLTHNVLLRHHSQRHETS